ncbi:MAG: hypothetical protein AAF804_21290, partial [Bacteroidota bacterium]
MNAYQGRRGIPISRRLFFRAYASGMLWWMALSMLPAQLSPHDPWVAKDDSWVRLRLTQFAPAEDLAVFKAGSTKPLWGRFIRQEDQSYFQPLVPFQPEVEYLILAKSDTLFKGQVPFVLGSFPEVAKVFPQGDTLPANLLKFYLQFSQPMSGHPPYPGLHLLDQAGDTLNRIFLNQNPALWNQDRTRLTLWLDPGRIKRELLLHQTYGPPLLPGQAYTLVIASPLQGNNGKPLLQTYHKHFFY